MPPRTSWLYQYGISLSSMRRYLFTLLFIALCCMLWFLYVYEPMQTRIEGAQAQSKIQRAQSVEELNDAIASLRTELGATATASSPSHDDQLHAVLGYADQAGLDLEHCAVQDKAIVLQASGTFKQIQNFFDQLAASTQRLLPRNVRITRSADNHFALSVIIETV